MCACDPAYAFLVLFIHTPVCFDVVIIVADTETQPPQPKKAKRKGKNCLDLCGLQKLFVGNKV